VVMKPALASNRLTDRYQSEAACITGIRAFASNAMTLSPAGK
jgi:hypothetical protein